MHKVLYKKFLIDYVFPYLMLMATPILLYINYPNEARMGLLEILIISSIAILAFIIPMNYIQNKYGNSEKAKTSYWVNKIKKWWV